MEIIGHDVAGDAALFGDEFVAEINPDDVLAVGVFLNDLVHLVDLAALWIDVFAAREDGDEENLGGGKFAAKFLNDGGDTFGDLFGGVVFAIGVVGPDHDDGGFWAETLEVAVIEAVEDMLGAVTTDAEIDGIVFGVAIRPDVFAFTLPTLRDGVADENELGLLADFLDLFIEGSLAALPSVIAAGLGIDGGVLSRSGEDRCGQHECGRKDVIHGR